MINISRAIKTISGCDPTPELLTRMKALAFDLNIPYEDAMFPILVMLDQYHGVFSELPEKMKKAAAEVAKAAAANTKHEVTAGLVSAISAMGPRIESALVDKAKAISKVNELKWIVGMALVIALVLTLSGWLMHVSGYSSGFEVGKAAGYKAAAGEKAAVAWANTDQGRMAYELSLAGELEKLANCSGEGWKLERSVCYPHPHTKGEDQYVTGWGVGKSAGSTPPRKINVSWLDYLFGNAA